MPSRYNDDFSAIVSQTIDQLTDRHKAREQALGISRDVIRFSANAIRAVHRGEFEEASSLISEAGLRLKETEAIQQNSPQIYYAGFLADARKEFTEANVTLAVLSGGELPSPSELGVDPPDYLKGISEVIGELRRFILDALRRDGFAR